MLRKSYLLVVVTALLAFFSPGLLAAVQETTPRSVSRQSPIRRVVPLWEVLTRWWAANGCGLDPHGLCQPAAAPAPPAPTLERLDAGCLIDPHGCVSQ